MIPIDLEEEARLLLLAVLDIYLLDGFDAAKQEIHDYLVDTHGNYQDIIKELRDAQGS